MSAGTQKDHMSFIKPLPFADPPKGSAPDFQLKEVERRIRRMETRLVCVMQRLGMDADGYVDPEAQPTGERISLFKART